MSVAPPLGKELASNVKKTRDEAVRNLRQFLVNTSASEKRLEKLEMAKLWKGLFYCFWLSDKPLVQQELASSLAELLLSPSSFDASLEFLAGFWEAMVREWSGLDYLRIDKYYLLVRRFVNASFRLLIRSKWSQSAVGRFNEILSEPGGPLSTEDSKIPTSLAYHLSDIYLEELDKAMSICTTETPDSQVLPAPLVTLLKPFMNLSALSTSSTTHTRLHTSLFLPLLSALLTYASSPLPIDNSNGNASNSRPFNPQRHQRNYRSTTNQPAFLLSREDSDEPRRKRARIEVPDLPYKTLVRNACLDTVNVGIEKEKKQGEEEEVTTREQEQGDENDAQGASQIGHHTSMSPQDIRAGVLRAYLEYASGDDTKEANRRRMYRVWKDACEAAEDAGIGNRTLHGDNGDENED